jgi:hypothetical protein
MGKMRTPLIIVFAAALALVLQACSTTGDACTGFRSIHPAIADVDAMSAGLARQIVAHNETGAKLCRWKP